MILISGGLGQLGQELARATALRRIPATALSRAQLDIANRLMWRPLYLTSGRR